jgi:hypothetical protein
MFLSEKMDIQSNENGLLLSESNMEEKDIYRSYRLGEQVCIKCYTKINDIDTFDIT